MKPRGTSSFLLLLFYQKIKQACFLAIEKPLRGKKTQNSREKLKTQ